MAWGNSLFEMTTEEAKEKLAHTKMAVIPTGSIEQHDPHLPLGVVTTLVVVELSRITRFSC